MLDTQLCHRAIEIDHAGMIPPGRLAQQIHHLKSDLNAVTALATQVVDMEVVQDRAEPTADTLQILELRRLSQGALDAILHKVVGGSPIPDEGQGVAAQSRQLSRHSRRERIRLTNGHVAYPTSPKSGRRQHAIRLQPRNTRTISPFSPQGCNAPRRPFVAEDAKLGQNIPSTFDTCFRNSSGLLNVLVELSRGGEEMSGNSAKGFSAVRGPG